MFNFDWLKQLFALHQDWLNASQDQSSLGQLVEMAGQLSKLSPWGTLTSSARKNPELGNWFRNPASLPSGSIHPFVKKTFLTSLLTSVIPGLLIGLFGFFI